jgi:prevent-host-death family protein
MTTIKATEARAKLYELLALAAGSHQPIRITSERSNAVLISEEDWRSHSGNLKPLVDSGHERIRAQRPQETY